MMYLILVICLALYLACSSWFLAYSLVQVHLVRKAGNAITLSRVTVPAALPVVTIQVPVYNEAGVIAGLLQQLSRMNYPNDCMEIQVLDDSTDDTSRIIDEELVKMRLMGMNVCVKRRTDRTGYKGGALQAALSDAAGTLIVIFDADFRPEPDFLSRLVHHFDDPAVGAVQARWQHSNLFENWLTTIQAYLLDCHFTLEQQGRAAAGYFVNFNGTAGIWRKQCIIDTGGWDGRVLTEDLDLSYRAQLRGWKLVYDGTVTVPAELPAEVTAFKTQQFRWAKGMAQVARRHLKTLLSAELPLPKKWMGFFHLSGSYCFPAIAGNILLAMPIIAGRHYSDAFRHLSTWIILTGLTLPLTVFYYRRGTRDNLSGLRFWMYLPAFLVVYMGLAVQNTVAVLQGYSGMDSAFVRTPKTGDAGSTGHRGKTQWSVVNSLEALALLYILVTIAFSLWWNDYFLVVFLLMTGTGLFLLLLPAIASLVMIIRAKDATMTTDTAVALTE